MVWVFHNFFEEFVARSLASPFEGQKLRMEKGFNLRFGRKYDSHGTSLNLFDVLAQKIGDCVMEDRDSTVGRIQVLKHIYHLTDRHFN